MLHGVFSIIADYFQNAIGKKGKAQNRRFSPGNGSKALRFCSEYTIIPTMRRNVRITVAARTRWEDGAEERESYTVPGVLEAAGGGWRVIYTERGAGDTETALAFSAGCVEWTRSGAVRSRLRFAPGESCASVYETPWGSFPLEARTDFLFVRLDETGGEAELSYELRIGGASAGHRLSIQVETEEPV